VATPTVAANQLRTTVSSHHPSLFYIAQTLVPTKLCAYGAVKTVTAVTGRDTGQPRGVAFVEMTNAGEVRDAIRTLNGSVHGGRALIVKKLALSSTAVASTSQFPVGITGAIVSKWLGRRCCWLFLRKHSGSSAVIDPHTRAMPRQHGTGNPERCLCRARARRPALSSLVP
jgi:RNA recognition motif-containing protein